jgi:hypothetical protein
LKLAKHGLDPLGGQSWCGLFMASPNAAGHQHPFTPFQRAPLAKPALACCIAHITAEPQVSMAAKALLRLG